MEQELTFTRSELIKVFELWKQDEQENSSEFTVSQDDSDWPETSADYIIELLNKTKK